MGYVITTIAVAVLLLVQLAKVAVPVAALIYAYKKLPRKYFLLLILILMAGLFWAFKDYERAFKLSVVPDALHVDSISYSAEESWGFGPGGNEAGIRVYPLTDQVARQITEQGLEFFRNMSPNQDQGDRQWRGQYDNWSETPVEPTRLWKLGKDRVGLNIMDYICAYGFCSEIKPEVVEEANSAVNTAGSYYAYGRMGLIVVNPKRKLVIYMYNG